MPKPLAARQSVRVTNVEVVPGTVQAVRFVQKTVRGNPLTWVKTAGLPKVFMRKDADGNIFSHLQRQKANPILSGETWKQVFLDTVALVWGGKKSSKSPTWHPAPDTKKPVAKKVAVKSVARKGVGAPTREEMEDFDDVEVLATTVKAKKAVAKTSKPAVKVSKPSTVGKIGKKSGGKAIDIGAEFDDDLSFPEA
jgi:hypothetical protein